MICLEKYKEKPGKVLKFTNCLDVDREKICNFEMKLDV